MRVVLLIPTHTYRASEFIAAATRLDVDVIVACEERPALADLMDDDCIDLDFERLDESASRLVALSHRRPLDAVLAVDAPALTVAAEASSRLGLRTNPVDAIGCALDKQCTRKQLAAHQIAQPAYAPLDHTEDAGAVAAGLGFPCVIKIRNGSAGRGVIRADDADGARLAAQRIRAIADDPGAALLVEAFVPGREVAVEALLTAGELQLLAVYDKPDQSDGPHFQESMLVTPSTLAEPEFDAVRDTTGRAARAIGLHEGPIHAELRVERGIAKLIEVNPRSIGGHCSRMLRFSVDSSLEDVLLRHALGLPFDTTAPTDAAGVLMLPIPAAGVLRRVEGLARARGIPGIEDIHVSVPAGDSIEPPPEGDRYLGFAFARAPKPDQVTAALHAVRATLEVVVDPPLR